MNYEEWARSVPEEITGDSLWKMEAYRLGLFVAEVGWHDVTKLKQDKRMLGLSDQLSLAHPNHSPAPDYGPAAARLHPA